MQQAHIQQIRSTKTDSFIINRLKHKQYHAFIEHYQTNKQKNHLKKRSKVFRVPVQSLVKNREEKKQPTNNETKV